MFPHRNPCNCPLSNHGIWDTQLGEWTDHKCRNINFAEQMKTDVRVARVSQRASDIEAAEIRRKIAASETEDAVLVAALHQKEVQHAAILAEQTKRDELIACQAQLEMEREYAEYQATVKVANNDAELAHRIHELEVAEDQARKNAIAKDEALARELQDIPEVVTVTSSDSQTQMTSESNAEPVEEKSACFLSDATALSANGPSGANWDSSGEEDV